MSDYSQITDFSAKDALSVGDPLKAVKGSDLDAELSAISVAVATKYDSTDIATQGEAEAGSSTTKLMTPLRAQQFLDALVTGVTKVKTAAETVNGSATLQDDDHIASMSLATGTHFILGVLHVSLKVASDIKVLLTNTTTPSGLQLSYLMQGATAGAVSATSTSNTSATALASAGSDEDVVITITGFVTVAASTMKLQWAQNSAVGEDTVMNIGSFVSAIRIA